jgi:hypothetical protein
LLNAKSITHLPVPGIPHLIERLGLKDAIAGPTAFWGAVSAGSKASDAARDLLTFLKSPTAIRVIKAQGMEPI